MTKEKFVIELGSSNTVIYKLGYGIVLREPSVLALDKVEKTYEVGTKAKKMQGKTDDTLLVVEPIEHGVITNEAYAELLLKGFLEKVCLVPYSNAEITFCTSIGLSDNQLLSFMTIAYDIGVGKVKFTDVCLSALKGAKVMTDKANALACVNLGGGTINYAVISLGKVIEGFSVNFGGKDMDKAIIDYIRAIKNMEITSSMAEKVKNECGSLYTQDTTNMEVAGIDVDTKRPVTEIITASDVRDAIIHFFENIMKGVEHLLYSCSPDVISDVSRNGIYLVGGLANFTGLENYLSKKLNLRVIVPDEPENCTILGACLK